VNLERFGLPHEPTAQESLAAGADVVLFSADKLIGGPQGGIIAGRRELIERIRKHPLARALRSDKTCLMALERTLMLFRDPDRLVREHPLYRMLAMSEEQLAERARQLAAAITAAAPCASAGPAPAEGYLGSGSCPQEALPSWAVRLTFDGLKPDALAKALRLDDAAVFARVEDQAVWLDCRTLLAGEVEAVAAACGRICRALRRPASGPAQPAGTAPPER
jgi:L-seryl-tRNA(Ser) seleniumtransferase